MLYTLFQLCSLFARFTSRPAAFSDHVWANTWPIFQGRSPQLAALFWTVHARYLNRPSLSVYASLARPSQTNILVLRGEFHMLFLTHISSKQSKSCAELHDLQNFTPPRWPAKNVQLIPAAGRIVGALLCSDLWRRPSHNRSMELSINPRPFSNEIWLVCLGLIQSNDARSRTAERGILKKSPFSARLWNPVEKILLMLCLCRRRVFVTFWKHSNVWTPWHRR